MKIVIVGTNHGGIAAANTILDNHPEHEVVMLDRNDNLSYLGCGTALWVGRQIDDYHGLFYTKAEDFEAKGGKISLQTNVTDIDFEQKVIYAKKRDGSQFEETYDKLILATGSRPIQPKIPGNDLDGIHYLKLFQEGQDVDREISNDEVKNVAVIGAGYIGVEIAEACQRRGKNVILFDAENHALSSYYDPEFSKLMDQNLQDNGIETHFDELVSEFKGENERVDTLVTKKGEYPVDLVISAIGFLPNSFLGADYLETLDNGAYKVNRHQQTSDPDVYAIGDCASLYSNALQDDTYIALASNAVRTGIVGGQNVCGTPIESQGFQGSNGISIYGFNMVSTGLTLKQAEKAGINAKYTEHEDTQLLGFMEDQNKVKLRITYEADTRRIIGAQMASYYDMSMGIHMFSLAIAKGVTIEELSLLDIFFLPHFNQPYNYITMAALKAE